MESFWMLRQDEVPPGKIILIIGPMFAGKTTELVRLVRRYSLAGMSTVMVKHSSENRYTNDSFVITHDGMQYGAVTTDTIGAVRKKLDGYHTIGIDEGQFFDDLPQHAVALSNRGHHVVIAGLSGTFTQLPFPNIVALIPHAESVIHLSAVCECGGNAHFTICRNPAPLANPTGLFHDNAMVGGSEKYKALCRRCLQIRIK